MVSEELVKEAQEIINSLKMADLEAENCLIFFLDKLKNTE